MKALTAALAACLLAWGAAALPASAPMRVLFVGNSYTYYNNLPCLVSELGKSRGKPIDATMIVEGGATLGDHWGKESTRAAVRQPWDAVVLQTQSAFGATYFVDGINRVNDTSELLRDARNFAGAVDSHRTRTVLFAHWKQRLAPDRDQAAIDAAFADAGRALRAAVVPAGGAWAIAARQIDPGTLYAGDGSHPSQAGSYLAALTTYATLTEDDPRGLPSSLTCPAVDPETEKPTAAPVTLTIAPATAAKLQAAAVESLRTTAATAGPELKAIDIPTLPSGENLIAADLRLFSQDGYCRAALGPIPSATTDERFQWRPQSRGEPRVHEVLLHHARA